MSSALDNVFMVNIVQANEPLIQVGDVVAVRIVSKDYNLLIMKDYMPIIGEVEGTVDVLGKQVSYKLDKGLAYFVSHNNIFTLIIKNGAIKAGEAHEPVVIEESAI